MPPDTDVTIAPALPAPAPANGHAPAGGVVANPVPPPTNPLPGLDPTTARRIQAELDALSPEDRQDIADAQARIAARKAAQATGPAMPPPPAPAPTVTGGAPVAPPSAAAVPTPATPPKRVDPYAPADHLMQLPQMAYLWSQEAMEATRYRWDGEVRYRPLIGMQLGVILRDKPDADNRRLVRGEDSIYQFLLEEPLVVADAYNRLVEVGPGKRVVVVGGHALRAALVQYHTRKDCPLVRIWPTGYQTHANGAREMNLLVLCDPDPNSPDPTKPTARGVSLESAMGRLR